MRCWTISILVVLLGSSYIHSQQASDKVSYEGQTVAAVDLVARAVKSAPSQGMAEKIKLDITVETSRDLNLIPLTTTINQYNLSLTFLGPLDKMQTSYVSDPPLRTADIINLIARGQTTQQAAASPSNLGASSLLAQGAASQVSSGVQKLAGLSSLSIDPTLGGNNSNPGARVAMQKRITSSFLFTFATDVTSTQREIIQGEYKLNKRWSASVTRDENGGFAVDGKYCKRY